MPILTVLPVFYISHLLKCSLLMTPFSISWLGFGSRAVQAGSETGSSSVSFILLTPSFGIPMASRYILGQCVEQDDERCLFLTLMSVA